MDHPRVEMRTEYTLFVVFRKENADLFRKHFNPDNFGVLGLQYPSLAFYSWSHKYLAKDKQLARLDSIAKSIVTEIEQSAIINLYVTESIEKLSEHQIQTQSS